MIDWLLRTEMLIGEESINKLKNSKVIIFGVGGVGGYIVEALARSGVGFIDVVDNDKFSETNINRQIYATHKTIGKFKVEVAKERILDINPEAIVNAYKTFYTPDTANNFDFSQYNYVIDAIDTVVGKLTLIEQAKKFNIPIICSMGTGNKTDATKFEVADISKTSVCPLARVIRTELKKRGIKDVKVVYSKEIPQKPINNPLIEKEKVAGKNQIPASCSFVPSVAGLIIAGEVVKDLIN
ncbi:tRNA threonylcarbamoyladenosine dehydratase [bacterium]|nr:tRNA threonylcarbamoyladenosine dehydratase [bacterium]